MVVRFLATRVIPVVAAGAAVTVYSSAAHAFFPPVPTGNQTVVTVPPVSPITVSPPPPTVPPTIPPVSPPPFVPPPVPPTSPPPPHVCDPGTPAGVPEPTTVLGGLIGLSMVGAAALKKKLGKKPGDATA